MNQFSKETAKALKYYVYRLIDPRDGHTFYIGKGKDDRVFAHSAQQLEKSNDPDVNEDDTSLKLRTIGEIHAAGLQVLHVIHRHGMDENTSFEVEAALMDAFPGLSNIAGGHGNNLRGCAHVSEIEQQYKSEEAPSDKRFIAVNVSKSIEGRAKGDYYSAARWQWIISKERRAKGAPVVAYRNGIIKAVFEIAEDGWLPAGDPEFKEYWGYGIDDNRWGFVSLGASEEITKRYVGKRLPDGVRSFGSPLVFVGPGWKE